MVPVVEGIVGITVTEGLGAGAVLAGAAIVGAKLDEIKAGVQSAWDKIKSAAQTIKDKITLGVGHGTDELPPRPEADNPVPQAEAPAPKPQPKIKIRIRDDGTTEVEVPRPANPRSE